MLGLQFVVESLAKYLPSKRQELTSSEAVHCLLSCWMPYSCHVLTYSLQSSVQRGLLTSLCELGYTPEATMF